LRDPFALRDPLAAAVNFTQPALRNGQLPPQLLKYTGFGKAGKRQTACLQKVLREKP
jgi:hypothetical protein